MMNSTSPIVNAYPLSNYTVEYKRPQHEKDTSVAARFTRMQQNYERDGMKRSVEAVLLVELMSRILCISRLVNTDSGGQFSALLALQIGGTFHKLPGGKLRPGENEIDGLKRKLTRRLAPAGMQLDWQIGECVATWWRPYFNNRLYSYKTSSNRQPIEPKECKKLYVVHLPPNAEFAIPRNFEPVAVPFDELYENSQEYGSVLSSLPKQLSRFQINAISP